MTSLNRMSFNSGLLSTLLLAILPLSLRAGERPYFVTYDHAMEEPGNLEVSANSGLGAPRRANNFLGSWTEFEYGVKGWWTSEFYLDGQTTFRDSTLFTGFRWENRFRPLAGEHWINPVLYIEYENLNEADKTLKEVVGFDSNNDFSEPNGELHKRKREIETKLILSSNRRGWNIAENFIAEKNLTGGSWEFGYAAGASRRLRLAATPQQCRLCRENFQVGIEFYGGLGTWHNFTRKRTAQYAAPVLAWSVGNGVTLRVSPTFGLTHNSIPTLMRFGISYEIPRFDRQIRRWLH